MWPGWAGARRSRPLDGVHGRRQSGQIAFNYPDHHYGSHEHYLAALADTLW